MDNFLFILAQAEGARSSGWMQFMPFILLMVGFWFLLIQPQRKKQKEHQKMLSELTTGDKIITSGGICGVITHVKKDRYQIKVDDSTRIDILKGSVQSRDTAGE